MTSPVPISTAQRLIGFGSRNESFHGRFTRQIRSRHGYEDLAFVSAIRELVLNIDPIVSGSGESRVRLSAAVKRFGWEHAREEFTEIDHLLRNAGQAGRRVVGPFTWVQIVMRQIAELDRCVVPDVCFPEEFTAIRSAGGLLVRVIRPGARERDEDQLARADWDVVVIDDDTSSDGSDALVDRLDRLAQNPRPWIGQGLTLRASGAQLA